jgi:[ribosomal protein S5]-alanine N-acetyltransferase
MIIARTARLTIRRFTAHDAGAMSAVLGDAEVMRYSDTGALQPPDIHIWIERQIARYPDGDGPGRWAIAENATGTVIGYAGLTREPERCETGEAELGFRLARCCWGRGYATEAAAAVLDYGFRTFRPRRIAAIVDPANAASVRVIEKLEMRFDSLVSFPGYDHPDRKYVLLLN